jgi:hypothetical protein
VLRFWQVEHSGFAKLLDLEGDFAFVVIKKAPLFREELF